MKFTKGMWAVILFNAIYVIAFTIYYLSIKNYEFLWYVAVLVFFYVLVLATLHRSKFDYVILWGLSLWGLMHMAGGGLIIGGEVLYKFILIPIVNNTADFTILKFDQFVHFFGFAVSTLVVYHLLKPYLNNKTNYKVLYAILIAAGMGLGALNEIVEFIAVLVLPDTGVGGYYNTSLDLVFNALGAIFAVIIIHIKRIKNGKRNYPR
jgi:hypothetical protein